MKKLVSLLLITTVLLGATACGSSKQTTDPTPTAIPTAAPTNAPSSDDSSNPNAEVTPVVTPELIPAVTFPVTVTDQAGRTVTIKSMPEKLVSSYYISTSTLIALGLTDKLVGIEAKANKRPIYVQSIPKMLELPAIGTVKELDLEACVALAPDLVILPLKQKNNAAMLEQLGVTVLFVNPESGDLLEEMIRLLATATGTTSEGSELLAYINAQREYLISTLAGVQRPTVYMAGNSDFLSTAGNAMYQSDLIALAGGKNVADAITDTYWSTVSYEQILAWNPEVILLAADASYSIDDVLNDKMLADCTAVKEKRVYQMPSKAEAWDTPIPGSILGAVWFAGILHSEQISPERSSSLINEFYQTYYAFNYNAD